MIALVPKNMKQPAKNYTLLLSILIIAFSVLVKVRVLDHLSIYSDYDEYYTASTFKGFFDPAYIQASQDKMGLLEELQFAGKHALRDSGNSTVYNFIGIILTRALGFSEIEMRLMSLFFYCFSLFIVVKIFQKFDMAALQQWLGIFILCFYSSFSQFSVIIRTYSFTLFLVLLLIYYLFVHRPENGLKTFLLTLLLCVAVFFSHFLTVFTLVLIWIYLIITTPSKLRSSVLQGVTMAGVICMVICFLNWEWITHFLDMSREIGDENAISALKNRSIPFTWESFSIKSLGFFSKYFFGGNAFHLLGMGMVFNFLFLAIWVVFSIQNRKNHFVLFYNLGGLITLLLVVKSQHFLPFGPKYNLFYLGFGILGWVLILKDKITKTTLLVSSILVINGLGNVYGNWKGPYPKEIQIVLNGSYKKFQPQQSDEIAKETMVFASSNSDTLTLKNEEELCLFQMIHEKKNCAFVIDPGANTQIEIPGFPKYYGPY